MEQELQHDGRLGMKWGKHIFVDHPSEYKTGAESASKLAGAASAARSSKQEKLAKKAAKKEAKTLTDEELKSRVTRMNLEEQYTKLSVNDKAAGKDSVKSFLNATTTALNVAAAALTVAVAVKQLSAMSATAKTATSVAKAAEAVV